MLGHFVVSLALLAPTLLASEVGQPEPAPVNLFVDANAVPSELNNGTPDLPYKTLAAAIAAAGSVPSYTGLILHLRGTFTEPLEVRKGPNNIQAKWARIQPWGNATATIDGGLPEESRLYPSVVAPNFVGSGILATGMNGFTVDGVDGRIRVRRIAGHAVETFNCNNVTLVGIDIEWIGQSAMLIRSGGQTATGCFTLTPTIYPGIYPGGRNSGVVVTDCRINQTNLGWWHQGTGGLLQFKPETISIVGMKDCQISWNTVSNSMMEGIDLKMGASGVIEHNVVEFTRSAGIYANESGHTDTTTGVHYGLDINNNIVRGTGYYTAEDISDVGGGDRIRVVHPAAIYASGPAGRWSNPPSGTYPPVYLLATGAVGIAVSTGDLCSVGQSTFETGSVQGVRIFQNEIYWTGSSGISIWNQWWGLGSQLSALCGPPIGGGSICTGTVANPNCRPCCDIISLCNMWNLVASGQLSAAGSIDDIQVINNTLYRNCQRVPGRASLSAWGESTNVDIMNNIVMESGSPTPPIVAGKLVDLIPDLCSSPSKVELAYNLLHQGALNSNVCELEAPPGGTNQYMAQSFEQEPGNPLAPDWSAWNADLRLLNGAGPALGNGVLITTIPAIANNVVGQPEIGAREVGAPIWMAGVTW